MMTNGSDAPGGGLAPASGHPADSGRTIRHPESVGSGMANPNNSAALELRNVSKMYGGLAAVTNVSITVRPGERRAIIGPNGAGKTTLFKMISGEVSITHGAILLEGRDISRVSAYRRVALGLGRTYQITNIFPRLTVEQNALLAVQGLTWRKFNPFGADGTKAMRQRIRQTLAQLHLEAYVNHEVRELGYGQQRQLELALALVGDPKVLLLDEPAAGLSSVERATMADIVRGLPRDLTVVLIEHDMDLAMNLVESVTCMHNGEVIAEDTPALIQQNPTVQAIYLGDMSIHNTRSAAPGSSAANNSNGR